MYTTLDIYKAYRSASGKPYRVPKDWETHLETKMNKPSRESIKTLTGFMNTKWRNIDLAKYMACGFELFKVFTYVNFFDKRIIALYISKDKAEKYNLEVTKKKLIQSAKFVLDRCRTKGYKSLVEYVRVRNGYESEVITDYLKGDIDSIFLNYLVYRGHLILEYYDEERLTWFMVNRREIQRSMKEVLPFLNNLEEKINEHNSKTT